MAISRLLISTFMLRKVRAALTITAIALAVSLVVAVTSSYTSIEAAIAQLINYYMGPNQIEIRPKADTQHVISVDLIDQIRQDPAVHQVVGRLITDIGVGAANGESIGGPPVMAIGVQLPQDTAVLAMKRDGGVWFDGSVPDEAVVDQVAAERLKVNVGDSFMLLHPERPLKLKVVGIVHKPAVLALQAQSIYLPLQTLQGLAGREGAVTRILVELKSGADQDAFVQRWTGKLQGWEPELRLRRPGERRREMQKNLEGVQFMTYMGGSIAMLAATFIVFATLSMGVAERTRTLAMLRAIGALRGQIGCLVVLEGILLAAAGSAVGVPLGWLWMTLLAKYHDTIFSAGAVLSLGGIVFGVGGMILASILASFMPAWNAMRVSPLEAMAPLGQKNRASIPWLAAGAGLVLIAVDPLLIYSPAIPRDFVFYAHFIVGLPALFIGFFLLSPAFVWIIERTLGRIIAFVLRLDYPLLRQQLTGSLWRAAGTATALMVGLAILIVMQVQGHTLINGWRLPTKFPDVFIVAPFGLDWDQQKMLEDVPGVRKGQILPFAIASPELGTNVFNVGALAVLPNATMFFGVDPDKSLEMIELEFRDGNPQDAARMLKQGRHLLVSDEFRQLKGYKVGDKLPLKTPKNGTVEYTIAGVIWSPGLDVIISAFDMGRQLDQRTVASVCGSIEDAKRDFGVERISLFAANLEYGIERPEIARRMTEHMNAAGTQPATAPKGLDLSMFQMQKLLGKAGFIVGDVRHIKFEIEQSFRRALLLLSTVALAAIAVASLGVTNTIMASIRTRQWQFGILRSIGVTRWQLLRLLLAESLLLGFVASALGLAAGFVLSVDAHGLYRGILGTVTPMTIPWPIIWTGVAVIVGVALGAAIWPAVSAARRQPLDLLQWGRAAA